MAYHFSGSFISASSPNDTEMMNAKEKMQRCQRRKQPTDSKMGSELPPGLVESELKRKNAFGNSVSHCIRLPFGQHASETDAPLPSLLQGRPQASIAFEARCDSQKTACCPFVTPKNCRSPPGLEHVAEVTTEHVPADVIDSSSFESFIKTCMRKGDAGRAEEHLATMRRANVQVTTAAMNAVIHACTRGGKLEAAERYIEMMESTSQGANIVSYNSVMNACAGSADLERAAFWFDRLLSRGLTPNEVTYGTLCKVLARHGEAAKIEALMGVLERTDIHMNEYFYASLISACMHSEPVDSERAERALVCMVSRGFSAKRVRGPLTRTLGATHAAELLSRIDALTELKQQPNRKLSKDAAFDEDSTCSTDVVESSEKQNSDDCATGASESASIAGRVSERSGRHRRFCRRGKNQSSRKQPAAERRT
eukprot:TRINITY_DN155_c0_g1_i1.p1 TRINITY_DN155_c0_g1~~TRINITY_DN155_c0_g1_i1.p1  ORF type:complete len:425 (-),score=62.60 TRINITY_DN155_c0_g1_i1:466-1740(-)